MQTPQFRLEQATNGRTAVDLQCASGESDYQTADNVKDTEDLRSEAVLVAPKD